MQITLGSCSYQAADPGEALATATRIRDGDATGWFEEWQQTADRVRAMAEECAAAGRRVSARSAYLRAATYYSNALYVIDATNEGSRLLPVWMAHRGCFDRFADLCDPPLERVEIPYEGTTLPGYFMRSGPADEPRPTVILNNGSDGPVSAMWVMGGAAALARGYNALAFDGPGQGAALFLQHLYFRPDWEQVVTPVVDYLLTRADVDPKRIAITGVSQGGYWVPRAVAFEHRIAAAVADPGVVDVSTSWVEHLPAEHAPAPRPRRAGEVRPRHGVRREGLEGPAPDARLPEPPLRPEHALRDVQGRAGVHARRRGRPDHVPDARARPRERAVLARPVAAALRRARMPEDDRAASPRPRVPTATASRSRRWCATSASSTGSTRRSPRSSSGQRARPATRGVSRRRVSCSR